MNQWPTTTKYTHKFAGKIHINRKRNGLSEDVKWCYFESETDYTFFFFFLIILLRISMFSPCAPSARSSACHRRCVQMTQINFNFFFLFPVWFTSKWHKSPHNPILKDTNSYMLYSTCPGDKRKIGSWDYASEWRTWTLLKTKSECTHASESPGPATITDYLGEPCKKQTEPRATTACEGITWCWHTDPGRE